jgi:hypothetical protein
MRTACEVGFFHKRTGSGSEKRTLRPCGAFLIVRLFGKTISRGEYITTGAHKTVSENHPITREANVGMTPTLSCAPEPTH